MGRKFSVRLLLQISLFLMVFLLIGLLTKLLPVFSQSTTIKTHITTPTANTTVTGNTTITALATDTAGETITAMEYFIDTTGGSGTTMTLTNTPSASDEFTTGTAIWDTTKVDDGTRTIYVHARVATSTWGDFDSTPVVVDNPPRVKSRTPASGETSVSLSTNVTVTFSDDVKNVSTSTFYLKTSGGTTVAATVSYANRVATLDPSSDLSPSTSYTAYLTSSIEDYTGHSLSSESWSFMTRSAAAASRIYGATRYQTAVEISKKGWSSASTVVLATGENFPDALAAAPLAYAYDGPILLTLPDSLPSDTKNEIIRLGATKVFLIGGTGAISATVESAVKAISSSISVSRIGGLDRYETAYLIGKELKSKKGSAMSTTAVIATGLNFPDALAVSSLAAYKSMPILLVKKDIIPWSTSQGISEFGITSTIIMGGTGVVSDAVAAKLPSSSRYSGANRFETAKALAEAATSLGMSWSKVLIATGYNFPDALAGGPYGGKTSSIILLVFPTDLDSSLATKTFLTNNKGKISEIYILGGQGAVSSTVETQINNALK